MNQSPRVARVVLAGAFALSALRVAPTSAAPSAGLPPPVSTNTMTVVTGQPIVYDAHGSYASGATLHALLENNSKKPIAGATIRFRVAGKAVGTARTDGFGNASLAWQVPLDFKPGETELRAEVLDCECLPRPSRTAVLSVDPVPLSLKLLVAKTRPGSFVNLNVIADGEGLPVPAGSIDFTIDGQAVGSAALPAADAGKATSTRLVYAVPVGMATGSHAVVARYRGAPHFVPNTTSVAGTLGLSTANLGIELNDATRNEDNQGKLVAGLYTIGGHTAVPNETIAFSVDGTKMCTANTGSDGIARCSDALHLAIGQHTVHAVLVGGAYAKTDVSEEAPLTIIGSKPLKLPVSILVASLKALNPILHLNNYGNPGDPGWYANNDSFISFADPLTGAVTKTVFDIPETRRPFLYYINHYDIILASVSAEGNRIKIVLASPSTGTAIIGRCIGGASAGCIFGDDSTAPDVEIRNASLTVYLTPAAYQGTLSYGAVDARFAADFEIDGVCKVANVCDAITNYKARIPAIIQAKITEALDGKTARALVGNAMRTSLQASGLLANRPTVTNAYLNAQDGNIYITAPLVQ